MSTTYRVVIKGVKEGFTEEQVVRKLAVLFKSTEEQVQKLMNTGQFQVKKGIDLSTSAKYQVAIEAAGAEVAIEPEEKSHEADSDVNGPNKLSKTSEVPPERVGGDTKELLPAEQTTKKTEVEPSVLSSPLGNLFSTLILKIDRRVVIGIGGALLMGSLVLIAKEPIQVYWQQHQQQAVIDKLSKIKPVTFKAIDLESQMITGVDVPIDWSNFATRTDLIKKAFADLQVKNDVALREYGFLRPFTFLYGAHTEPEENEAALFDEIQTLLTTHPALAIVLGEMEERLNEPENAYKRYEEAIAKGSLVGLKKFEDLAQKEGDFSRLFDLYSGIAYKNPPVVIKDYRKLAEYFGMAVGKDKKNIENEGIFKIVLSNGPEVAAKAGKYFFNSSSPLLESKIENAVTECNIKSASIADPANWNKGVYPNQKGSAGIAECTSAVRLSEEDSVLWFQLGYALERNSELKKAKIAYARSAELGSSSGIARFWWIDFDTNPQRSISMLLEESGAGNPWGDYFLGHLYYAHKEILDYEKSEKYLLAAEKSGITYSRVLLGTLFNKKGDGNISIEWYKKAAEIFPNFLATVGLAYLKGDTVEKNVNMAREWYLKAEENGVSGADKIISRIGKARNSNVTGTWACRDLNPNGTTTNTSITLGVDGGFSSISGREGLGGRYERVDQKITLIVTNVSNGSAAMAANAKISIDIVKLSENVFNYVSVVNNSGNKRSSECSRGEEKAEMPIQNPQQQPIYQSSPPPSRTIEDELRANNMSQKCQMLQNAFGDSPTGHYQMEKAGCL